MDLSSEQNDHEDTENERTLLRSCKCDRARKQQIVSEQTSRSNKHLEATQSLLKAYMEISELMTEWHEEESQKWFT